MIASVDSIAVTRTIAKPSSTTREPDMACPAGSFCWLRRIPTTSGIPPRQAIFFHIPPDYGAKIPAVAERLAQALTQVIDRALARLEPVRIFERKTTAGFAHNRRRRGVVAGRPSSDDVLDHDLPVFDCVDAAGKRKAIVFGYACHNTTIPPDDLHTVPTGPAWPAGSSSRPIARQPRCSSRAGADKYPEPRGSVELSQRYGREIAAAVQEALESPGVEVSAVRFASHGRTSRWHSRR